MSLFRPRGSSNQPVIASPEIRVNDVREIDGEMEDMNKLKRMLLEQESTKLAMLVQDGEDNLRILKKLNEK